KNAMALLDWALALHRAHGIVDWLPATAGALSGTYILAGRVEEAFPLLEEAVAVDVTTSGGPTSPRIRQLGEACLSVGRIEEAIEHARNALALAREHGQQGNDARALHALAEASSRQDPPDLETAEEFERAALGLAQRLGMRPVLRHNLVRLVWRTFG